MGMRGDWKAGVFFFAEFGGGDVVSVTWRGSPGTMVDIVVFCYGPLLI